MTVFAGRTEDGACPILRQSYWSKGVVISGTVIRKFPTKNGECYELKLPRALEVSGRDIFPEVQERVVKLDKVGIGEMAGFKMALAAAGLADLQPNDIVELTCTGEQNVGRDNNMTLFRVKVDRPDSNSKRVNDSRDERKTDKAPF